MARVSRQRVRNRGGEPVKFLGNTSMIDASDDSRTTKLGERCRFVPYHRALIGIALAALMSLTGCNTSVQLGPQAVAGLTPDGTVNMDEVQVAYLASAGGGNGTLYYQGAAYTFSIGGLGVGGGSVRTIDQRRGRGLQARQSGESLPGTLRSGLATASLSATRAAAICGCRMRRA